MSPSQGGSDDRVLSRRSVLGRIGGAAGIAAGTAGCIGDGSGSGQGTTAESSTVTFGLTTSQSGRFNAEGDEERRGFELAVTHLNEGGGFVDSGPWPELSGDGVLGRDVETSVHDTGGSAQEVDEIERSFERNEDIAMYTGGLNGDVVLALREAADEHGVPYMAGPTPLNSVTGTNCSEYVFRELFSATAIARALVPTLVNTLGQNVTYYHISVDDTAGADLERAIDDELSSGSEWRSNGSSSTVPGSTNFEDQLQVAEGTVPEVVFLNQFGLDAANALTQARDAFSSDIQIVVPFVTRPLAETVSDDVENVLGTVPWNGSINSDLSGTFEDAYRREYGSDDAQPSGIAHHTYVQTLQYAAAAERAGSFEPDDVVAELGDHSYDVGLDEQTMRACDHQATRPVPVVSGRLPSEQQVGRYLSLLNVAEDATPSCDEAPATDCSF